MTCACCAPEAPVRSGLSRRLLLAGGAATGVALLPGARSAFAEGPTRAFGFLPARPGTEQHVRPIMFPVLPDPELGKATWSDTYGAPRGGGTRSHEGQDLMGKKMLKLLACTDGEVVELRHQSSGNSLYIKGDDDWYYCYLHINNDTPGTDDAKNEFKYAFAEGLKVGSKVKKGEHVAFLGDSGNAEGTGSHCHFEIRMPNAKWYNAAAVNAAYSLRAAEPAQLLGSAPVVSTGVFAPFADAESFAKRQSTDFLAKTATTSWLATATKALETTSADDFIVSLLDDPAQADVVAPAVRLYQAYFLRRPDTAGINFWIGQVRKGVSLDKVSDKFATSSEFINRYGQLGNADFVRRVYLNLFEREPDNSGYLYWTMQLDHGKERGWVMRQLCESNEYQAKTQAQVDVTSINLAMLGVVPSASDYTNWTSMARAAHGAVAMFVKQIRTSTAYADRVA